MKAKIEQWNQKKIIEKLDQEIYSDYLKSIATDYFDHRPVKRLGLRESNFLKNEVNKLPIEELVVIHLIYWKGKRESEIAELFNRELSEIKDRHERALETLRRDYMGRLSKYSRASFQKGERRLLSAI